MISRNFQKLQRITTSMFFSLFFDVSVYGKNKTKDLKGPLIIVINHKSTWDPFFLGLAFKVSSSLWPFGYLVAVDELKIPWMVFLDKMGILRLYYVLSGCIPAVKKGDIKISLEKPSEEMQKKKRAIVFFVEGEIIKSDELGKGRRGAAALARLSGAKVLPMSIKCNCKDGFKNFWKRKVVIRVGDPFLVPDLGGEDDQRYKKETDLIMQKIGELYYKKDNEKY